jgi:hypothetical protein
VRTLGRRTKKLVVAFHFQYSNQAGWGCDACRKNGLEKKRRCGFLPGGGEAAGAAPVWTRARTVLTTCPKSYITSESLSLLEQFHAWKLFGNEDSERLPARTVDAFFVLERELIEERANGEI